MPIHNPHDKTFRELFSRKEQAADLIRLSLPSEIVSLLDLESLESQPDTFIDDSFKDVQSDLLFSVRTISGNSIQVYTLFEHKSYQDPQIHLQLLSYLVRIYSKMERVIPVIPLVFYHGERGWETPLSFSEILDFDSTEKRLFAPYLPDFRYCLMDLSRTPVDDLILSLTTKAILYTFKNIWHLEDKQKLEEFVYLCRDLAGEPILTKLIQRLLLYIYGVKEIAPETVISLAAQLQAKDLEGLAMTTAEKLKEEGIREGIKEGKLEDARKMLEKGLEIELICEITGLSIEEITELKKS